MQRDYTAFLEKSIVDFLQYTKKPGAIDELLRITFEAILRAEQKGFLGYGYGEKPVNDNKRNGHRMSGLIRGLTSMFRVKVPRDRAGLFKPMFLELLKEETDKINELVIDLYIKGLSTKEISEVVDRIYGKRMSKTMVSNISKELEEEIEQWKKRPLEREYYVIFIDALRLPIKRGGKVLKECGYIAMGLRKDLKREILGIYIIPQENYLNWKHILNSFKERGVEKVLLFVTDEVKLIEEAIEDNFPEALTQRCIIHKKRNIDRIVRASDRKEIMAEFDKVLDIDNPYHTIDKAIERLDAFIEKWGQIYPSIENMFKRKEEYFSYLRMPFPMRRMVYTNNWIENFNDKIKRTTKIRRSFPNPKSAERLVILKAMEMEEKTYMKYPVSVLMPVKHILDEMLNTGVFADALAYA